MKQYIYKLYSKYFNQYKNNVGAKIGSLIRASETQILNVCLDEINKILNIISGQLTSSLDIPKKNKFPTSTEFNKFLQNIEIDLDKLYTANSLIINDVQNVANYNSFERFFITNYLSNVQGKVYRAFISSQKNITGSTIIREDFNSIDVIDYRNGSEKITVDTVLKSLTLKPINESVIDRTSINYNFIDCFHLDNIDSKFKCYPNNTDLSPGRYWKMLSSSNEIHFSKKFELEEYRKSMSDDQNTATTQQLSSCQYEAVVTLDSKQNYHSKIEKLAAKNYICPESDIYINRSISITDSFIADKTMSKVPTNKSIVLRIPFTNNASLSNGCYIVLKSNDDYDLPSLIGDDSYCRSIVTDKNGKQIEQKTKIISITKEKIDNSGSPNTYKILFAEPLVPKMLELTLKYDNAWPKIPHVMSVFTNTFNKNVKLDIITQDGYTISDNTINNSYSRNVYLLTDTIMKNYADTTVATNLFNKQGLK